MVGKIKVGDVVRCVDPRTWPFLKRGERYEIAKVFPTGEYVKLNGQPPSLFEMFTETGPLIDWLPVAMFKREG